MKQHGACPKCGSQSIINPSRRPVLTKIGMVSVEVLTLVCTDCGYYEKYVDSDKQLQKWKAEIGQ